MKIDTHRHLGGSISTECIWKILQSTPTKHLVSTFDDLENTMKFTDEAYGFNQFLNKFKILDEIQWTEELIDIIIEDVCRQISQERLEYCWLDFSVNKYMNIGWQKLQAIHFLYERFEHYLPNKIGLILSLKYESAKHDQKQYAQLLDDIAQMVIGIDLVGDEAFYDAQYYRQILYDWKQYGKMIRAHVGESQNKDNIISAIQQIGVTNIAHGIKGHDDGQILQISKDNDITYDMAITSNIVTAIWSKVDYHPFISMLKSGVKVTIGSDDPVQCNTDLRKEYDIASDMLKCNELSSQYIQTMIDTSVSNTEKYRSIR